MQRLQKIALSTLRTFQSAPLHFLFLQTLEGISSVTAKSLEGRFETQPVLAVLFFFPIFCIASTLSNAFTYLSIRERRKGHAAHFSEILALIQPRLKTLILASLALGLVFVLGFAALILPAFYLMSIYLFVPQILVRDENASVSLGIFRSSKLAKTALPLCFLTVALSLVIGIVTFLLSESLGKWAGGIAGSSVWRFTISLSIDAFLSMVTGAMIDIWISELFFELTEDK